MTTHHADIKCDSCRYNVLVSECKQFDCPECGKYNICEYCFLDYKDKNDNQGSNSNGESDSEENQSNGSDEDEGHKGSKPKVGKSNKEQGNQISCIYCWSKKTLTDM